MNKKGFTLIELLVVIAIIGVLASVVLASLNTARDKGKDAAIKANLANIRAQAELYYDDNGNQYATSTISASCSGGLFNDGVIANAITAANAQSGGSATCYAATSTWAVSVPLSDNNHWCVDSTGAAESLSSAVSGQACS